MPVDAIKFGDFTPVIRLKRVKLTSGLFIRKPCYDLLPTAIHRAGKDQTQSIERKHLDLRTRIKRLARRTIYFSNRAAGAVYFDA